jgi:glycosyltransferase involved in cell wall biosynthesis
MRILLVTPFVPHRSAGHGTATVVSRFVEHFAARHELSVVTFHITPEERELAEQLKSRGVAVTALPFPGVSFWHRQWARARTAFDRRPFMVSLYDVPRMRKEIRKQLRATAFDLVHIDTTQMGAYVELVRDSGAKTALIEIDVSMKPLQRRYEQATSPLKRWLHRREWQRMCHYEPELCRKFDVVYSVCEEDRRLLEATGASRSVGLFRYGVDADFFAIPPKQDFAASLVFVGSFMHPPNVDAARWFVEAILPRIREHVPDAHVHLVGGWQDQIADLAKHPGVVVTGWVDDVKRYLAMADVCVVPLRWGGGVKLKTLEMMAAGRPVVATSVGTEGIDVENGADVLLAASADEFADRTIELLRDGSRRERLGQNARRLVMRDHRWTDNLQRIEREYELLVDGRGHSTTAPRVKAGPLSVTS